MRLLPTGVFFLLWNILMAIIMDDRMLKSWTDKHESRSLCPETDAK